MIVKKIKNLFKLEIFCNNARFEDQGIGPVLSPYILRDKINSFCEEFNNLTLKYNSELRVSVKLILFIDNSFFFIVKGPNISNLVKILLNVNNLKLLNTLNIFDFYDILYIKNLFLYKKNGKFNNFIFKNQLKNAINSIKNFKIIKI